MYSEEGGLDMKDIQRDERSDTRRKTPSYQRIATDLRRKVASGQMTPGLMLPGRRDLAVEYGVSVPTIGRAVADLLAEGTLRADLRRGTFVGTSVPAVSPRAVAETAAIALPASERSEGPLLSREPSNHLDSNGLQAHSLSPLPRPIVNRAPLRNNISNITIGIAALLPHVSSESEIKSHYSEVMVSAIERATTRSGGRSHFHNLWREDGRNPSASEGYEALIRGNVDVALLVHVFPEDSIPSLYHAVEVLRVPAIVINEDQVSAPLYSVYYDHAGAAYQATKHLFEEGCSEVVFFSARSAGWVEGRWQGVRRAIRDGGRPERSAIERINRSVNESEMSEFGAYHGGYKFARQLLESEGEGLLDGRRGIVAANDSMALGFIRAAAELGFVLQRDYVIIGFDDHSESRQMRLSTMRPPFEEMGREMVRLATQIVDEAIGPRRVCLHSQLVARSSSRFEQPQRG